MNYDKIYQDFVGKNKIQPLNIRPNNDNSWILRYKEGNHVREIECEDREDLDKILIEFGGKNPETCKTTSKFLEIGEWDSEDLVELGHRITKISLSGQRVIRQKNIPFDMPDGTGSQSAIQSKRSGSDTITLRMIDREMVDFTRSFNTPDEFDKMLSFINEHSSFKDIKWFVKILGTESKDTGKQCVWKRVQAGDGTKRMVLELRELDGVSFRDCVRQDLFNAAGEMFDAPCKRVKVKKKRQFEKDICLFAAEDGAVNLNDFEAAS